MLRAPLPARPAPPPDGTASTGSSRDGGDWERVVAAPSPGQPAVHTPTPATAGLVHGEEPGDSRPDLKESGRRGGEGSGLAREVAREVVDVRRHDLVFYAAGLTFYAASRSCRRCWSPGG